MKFLEFLSTELCIHQKMQKEKEKRYGGLVKFSKKLLDGPYGQAHQSTAEEDVDDDDDRNYSITFEYSGYDNLKHYEENLTDLPLFSHSFTSSQV